jgi:hypothetical protein
MYVPAMQEVKSGPEWGKNIAGSLLEAVKMNREYEHKGNVMAMEREKLDMLKESYGLDKTQREVDMHVFKTREAHNKKADADYLKYAREKQKFAKDREAWDTKEGWWRMNPFKDEADYAPEYDILNPDAKPKMENPEYGEYFEEKGTLPSAPFMPEEGTYDTRRRTFDETLSALMYPNGNLMNYGGLSHFATYDDE